ncbi:dihydrodipicolinate reductase [Streptomyces olindensis]|uniref:Dihydrodipicolinate reductase n=1 Tax=Streptomyces olindensis TaxID=358823 RepID=A0ABV2XRW7_9ACTN
MTDTTRIALVGLGATGLAIGRALAGRRDCTLVGAADISPERVGRDLGELLGGTPSGTAVVADPDVLPLADVAMVATTSMLDAVEPVLSALVRRGVNVVSICEELGHPFLSHPEVSGRLDKLAVEHGVAVLGTGCNPGMIMDTLPLLLSSLTQRVRRVRIRRTADMSRYGAILAKFGLGLTEERFAAEQGAGRVIGHVGFEQSVAALAAGLGWDLDEIVVDAPRPALLAAEPRSGEHIRIEPGTVAAVLHGARGLSGGEAVIELGIHFGLFQPGDPMEDGDACVIEGDEQTVEVRVPGGYESFLSTVAVSSNAVVAAVGAAPGLRTMADLPVAALASKGAWRR